MTNNSKQSQQEAISALLDNELKASQIDGLCNALSKDKHLRQQLARHQMINCGLRAEHINLGALSIADAVNARLQDEPTILAPTRWRQSNRWVQPLMGTALAASVAALGIVFAPQLLQQNADTLGFGTQFTAQPQSEPAIVAVASQPAKAQTPNLKSSKELAPYLKDHNQYAAPSVIPYASYVSYDAGKR